MGAVYRGMQPSLSRTVAIKVLAAQLASDPSFIARFRREAVLIANVKHPHIVTVFDFGQQGDILYLVMEYVAGSTLRDRPAGPMDPVRATELVRQIADALDYAHRQGVIHRDIKPANIILERPDFAKLADFGIARLTDDQEQLTQVGQGVGTPEYMSPEQGEGLRNIDGRSDIYSLGIVLFQLLTGEVPFSSTSLFDIIRQHMERPLPVEKMIALNVPMPIVNAVVKATAKRPDDRFQAAGQFRDALVAALRTSAASQTVVPGNDPTVLGQQPGLPNMLQKQTPPPYGTSNVQPPAPQYGTSNVQPPAPQYGGQTSYVPPAPGYGGQQSPPPGYGGQQSPPPGYPPPASPNYAPSYSAAPASSGAATEVRPPEKKKGGKGGLIFAILFVFLCMGCVGMGVLFGGAGVLGGLAALSETATPTAGSGSGGQGRGTPTPADFTAAEGVGERYMAAIRDGKWKDAEGFCLPELVDDINSQGGMEKFITSNDVRPASWKFTDRDNDGVSPVVSGDVVFTRNRNGRVDLTFVYDGTWKIDSISLYEN